MHSMHNHLNLDSQFVFFGPLPPARTAGEVVKHLEDVATGPMALADVDATLKLILKMYDGCVWEQANIEVSQIFCNIVGEIRCK